MRHEAIIQPISDTNSLQDFVSSKVRYFALFVVALLLGSGCSSEQQTQSSIQPRETIELNQGWRFAFDPAADSVSQPAFDDTGWESVTIPHSWNRVGYYQNDLHEHLHTEESVNNAQGVGWYRLTFTGPDIAPDRRVFFEFDGASRTAEVWLNGQLLGEHRNPFSRFRFDATSFLNSSGENVLAVKTDNSKPEATSTTADVLPIAGDFFVHGGIYRPVRMLVANDVHLTLEDHGGPGVYVTTQQADHDSATLQIRSIIKNERAEDEELIVEARLIDANNVEVASVSEPLTVAAGDNSVRSMQLMVANPNLWHGVVNPYLYRLEVQLLDTDAELLDSLSQNFGIRTMAFDPDAGFILNGEPYRLRGVSYHQDREGKGWAVSREDIAQDMAIVRDMGANTIRLAHYQHGQPVHELADQYGFILWDEIGLVTSWSYGSGHPDANAALANNAKQQLIELIRQNYNHASVVTWGIANEVDFGAVLPAFLGAPASDLPDPLPLLNELSELAKEEDPSRPSVLANCCDARDVGVDVDVPLTPPAAVLGGANRYFGWYYGEVADLSAHLRHLQQLHPEQPLSVSEYGAGGAISQHTDNPLGGPVDSRGVVQPEEFMTYFHESSWEIISENDSLWGSWVWNGFDFATNIRVEGDSIDINTKGLITYDRQIKKDSYYFYRANWSENPTVYITGRRYTDRAYPVTHVRVYSNAPETNLYLNGANLGAKYNCPMQICTWENVRLEPGENLLSVVGKFASEDTWDEIRWMLPESQTNAYHVDSGALLAAPSTTYAYGSDNFYSGGIASTADVPGGWGRPVQPAEILDTTDRAVLTTYRQGSFEYQFPVVGGQYELTLHFMEPEKAAGERIFNVMVNGDLLLQDFDIAAEAGSILRAYSSTHQIDIKGDELVLAFLPSQGDAIVSAVTLRPL